ncbi:MAG: UDP-3-O-(3-hydroxymyristoyl)glucosamine N-acyltransferase [Syntrophobacteraceae bacterium]
MNELLTGRDSYSLDELGRFLHAEVKGDPQVRVRGIAALDTASPDRLSFFADLRYRHLLSECRAAALIVSSEFQDLDFNLIITDNPYLALAKAAQLFHAELRVDTGIHPAAFLGKDVVIGEGVSVGPQACVSDNCVLGFGTRISSGAYLGRNVRIGEQCIIHPKAAILDGCVVGDRVIIQAGAIIGSDGYGYAHDEQGRHIKIPQTGIVQIDDDVEIGANTTIDRATFGKTWIKRGAKIDNLVMIAHNVEVGEDSLLVAQVGISGSTHLGDGVILGGQVGIAGHINIGDRVKIGAKSGILHSIKSDQNVMGIPAVPYNEWFKTYANIQRLPRLKEELKRLRERVQRLEEELRGDDGHTAN